MLSPKRLLLASALVASFLPLLVHSETPAPTTSEPNSGSIKCSESAAFFGAMGCASALIFANLGSAYGTAKSGIGIAHLGIIHADRIMRGIVPVVMAGILGIYGLIVAVIINGGLKPESSAFSGYLYFGAGLAAGLSSLASGLAIGIVGDASVRAYGKQEKIFVAMILMLIFAEVLGLFGLIVALMMSGNASKAPACVW